MRAIPAGINPARSRVHERAEQADLNYPARLHPDCKNSKTVGFGGWPLRTRSCPQIRSASPRLPTEGAGSTRLRVDGGGVPVSRRRRLLFGSKRPCAR